MPEVTRQRHEQCLEKYVLDFFYYYYYTKRQLYLLSPHVPHNSKCGYGSMPKSLIIGMPPSTIEAM